MGKLLRLFADWPLYFLTLTAVAGSLVYLAFGLTLPVRIGVFIVALIGARLLTKRFSAHAETKAATAERQPLSQADYWTMIAYLFLAAVGVYCLLLGRSDRALITPWVTVPSAVFVIYALATLLLFSLKRQATTWLLCIHYAWSFSVFWLVYTVGYGFDPFIHQASIKAIEEFGKIQPTTIYYLGQYSLVTVLHTVFGGTIAFWDKVLVPLLAAALLPPALKKFLGSHSSLLGIGLTLLLFSYSPLTVTTPQNLAYVFLAVVILRSLKVADTGDRIMIWLLALAAFFTQPIAGLPALVLAASVTLPKKLPQPLTTSFKYLALTAYLLLLPASFYFFAAGTGLPSLSWPDLGQLFASLAASNPSTESWWLNFLYLFASWRGLIFIALAVIGFIAAWRRRQSEIIRTYGLPALMFVVSACLVMAIDFNYLINYERADYPGRLLIVAALFALPLVIPVVGTVTEKIKTEPRGRRFAGLIFLSLAATASLYLSYPRFDHYYNSRGYATSEADLEAVRWIEQDAGSADYVVLANQQTSAAALRQSGFKKYFHDDIFYYPIPTGGKLYPFYLEMLEQPSRETMTKAMDLVGVDRAYFVIDDYWWAADKIADEADVIANETKNIKDGQARVFKFVR